MKKPLLQVLLLSLFFFTILSESGCKKSSSTADVATIPTVTTDGTIINLTSTSAQSGGIIAGFGNAAITANGVVYSSTNTVPTTSDGKTTDAILGDGAIDNAPFTSSVSGLSPNTTYYLRAYATNSAGTGYGSVVKFTTSTSLTAITSAVTTFAGSGTAGSADGTGTAAQFNNPEGLSVDAGGNVYVSDTYNSTIRKVTSSGAVTTLAGNGSIGYVDGPAASAEFYAPMGSAFDANGNLYVADYGNNVIRKITPAGIVSTYAGNGTAGFVDGSTAKYIEFNSPTDVAFDAAGNLYVADRGNNVIRKITPAGVVSSLAGYPDKPNAGYVNATDQAAYFNQPNGLTVDATANVFVADINNFAIRKVTTPAGVVTTVAGGPSQQNLLNYPVAIKIDKAGNLYIIDETGRLLEYTTANVLYVLAGSASTAGFTNGAGTAALFNNPQALALDASGNIYIADKNNNVIRKIVVTLNQ